MTTQRFEQTFAQLKTSGKTAFVPYLPVGFPNIDWTVPLMHTLVESGADVIELGVPFSDPMADGPVIQRATEKALANGVRFTHILDAVTEFRKTNDRTPIVLMGYLNSIEARGYEQYATQVVAAGVDGVLTVDMPPESACTYVGALSAQDLAPIFLVAPTTQPERVQAMIDYGRGYLYYVSLKGITGAGHLNVDSVQAGLDALRAKTDLPVAVGFGIKTAEQFEQVGAIADGVVVGSALIEVLEANQSSLQSCQIALEQWVKALLGAA